MLPSVFRYLYHKITAKEAAALGFVDAGFGIEQRARRFSRSWQPHLHRCKELQARWIQRIGTSKAGGIVSRGQSTRLEGRLSIVGAGRLFDLNREAVCRVFDEIVLFDGDPSAIRYWRAFERRVGAQVRVVQRIGDVTRVLRPWATRLRDEIAQSVAEFETQEQRWNRVVELVRLIPLRTGRELPNSLFVENGGQVPRAILSLNILSQLPICWQEIVDRELQKVFEPSWMLEHEAEWLAAYTIGGELLIKQHLRDLAAAGAEHILIITDIKYYYQLASAEVVKAPALLGVELEDPEMRRSNFHAYSEDLNEEWSWQVVPGLVRGLSRWSTQQQARHRVAAWSFIAKR